MTAKNPDHIHEIHYALEILFAFVEKQSWKKSYVYQIWVKFPGLILSCFQFSTLIIYEIFLFEHDYMKFWIMLFVHMHLKQSCRIDFF